MWLTGNCVAYTINNINTKVTVSKMDQSGDGVALVQLLISIPTFTVYALFYGELPEGIWAVAKLPSKALGVFLFLGLMGTLISLSYGNLYKLVSATSVVVAANVNKIVAIILGYVPPPRRRRVDILFARNSSNIMVYYVGHTAVWGFVFYGNKNLPLPFSYM